MELKEGAVVAERFRLVRMLGKGGMGEVWAAQHTSLDIPCAVKFIHAEAVEKVDVRERFEREAKAAAMLRTPNVVQILDYGVFEDTPYIAMEYLDGEPLSARLQRRGRLDPLETFQIVTGVGKALTKAHAARIVHRDLKPENIFLVPDDDREIAKVLDFGVAKQTTEALTSNTKTGALLGTPYFMSPEQAQGVKAVDSRADLWSLAVVTFRCLTGELPFKSHALGDLLIKIVTHPLPMPSHVCPGLPENFDAWWTRAAERDPDRRFQTAKELIEALGLALNVTAPGQLGMTPMPGARVPRQPPPPGQTMIADPNTGPPFVGGTPFAQSGASQQTSVPQALASNTGARHLPTQPLAAYHSGNYPAQPLGDSGSSASVAGFTATPYAPPGAAGKKKGLVIAAVVGIVGVLGVAGFFLASGSSDTQPSPGATEESTAKTGESETTQPETAAETAPETTAETTAETAEETTEQPPTETSASAEPAKTETPVAQVRPRSVPKSKTEPKDVEQPQPRPKGPPTDLGDIPKSKPKPKPKPKGYNPGF